MLACKETAFLHLVAMVAAFSCCLVWKHRQPPHFPRGLVLPASLAFVVVSVAFYTWLGRDWHVLSELMRVAPQALARAGGEGHEKPIRYFAQLLAGGWSGGVLSLLAAIGCWAAFRPGASLIQSFFVFYFLILAGIYSAIPYKTPWLALNLWPPLALLVGLGIQELYRRATPHWIARTAMGLAGSILVFAVAHDTQGRVYLHPADEGNPYAYAHTSEDILDLPAAIDRLAREGGLASPRIAVIAADPWPLPWYLRKYTQTGYWQPGQVVGPADIYITSTEAASRYDAQLHDLRPEFFGVRPGVLILVWSRVPE
jgi:predicted membrane-bound mannosyltransferase